ncbi:hypothetical protein [Patiriisocius marinus]|uniref:hypothetical protein n=1 Tax=Patiriisocius marinus TaxID=1397112 RepID=UPI00232B210C|nr:hypothetical protein [Patiriisocius marinus]
MKLITLICSFIFIGLTSYGQSLIDNYPAIKFEKELIDTNDSLKIIVLENEDFLDQMGDGGGKLKAYYNTELDVKKIEVILFKSLGIQQYTFYAINEKLIFIKDRFKQFEFNIETNIFDYSKFDGGYYGAYIFEKNKLIDLVSTGHNRFEDDAIDAETTFKIEFNSYLSLIKNKLSNSKN